MIRGGIMEINKNFHLILKYHENYENTKIDTINEHIGIDKEKGEVVWGAFTRSLSDNSLDAKLVKILDSQIEKGIPTFVFLYNGIIKKLFISDYIKSYSRYGMDDNDKHNLIPQYYHHKVGVVPDGTLSCKGYIRMHNIREIDFNNKDYLIHYKSKKKVVENPQLRVGYLNLEEKYYNKLSNEFVSYAEDNIIELNDEVEKNSNDIRPIDPDELSSIFTDAARKTQKKKRKEPTYLGKKIDFEKKNRRDALLGKAGELFVLEVEKAKLNKADKKESIKKIEHTSVLRGDGTGYDIKSVDLEGNEIYIEVKTTTMNKYTPFNVSWNEMEFSKKESSRYYLYRVYEFDVKLGRGKIFFEKGSIEDNFNYEPVNFHVSK